MLDEQRKVPFILFVCVFIFLLSILCINVYNNYPEAGLEVRQTTA